MDVAISKQTLKHLNQYRGYIETGTELVFVGFVGRLHMADGLYHGTINYAEPGEDWPGEFSITNIINGGNTDGDT